ncbi:XRE family transcriptional regulator [Actinophytocola glycyrrhizae]|uniref:XRE family transcriptional regulator n=1 Tax=Actinophytocola glycyrrhizae TaxID=2044873 RepID=A0ABV9S552_9PSEU
MVDPALRLAQKLRQLRIEGLAGTSITQRELGAAIGASGPLISSWESSSKPKAPPHARLASYCSFFATERSVAQQPFRVLPVAQLTSTERARRDELLHELTSLWNEVKGHKPGPAAANAFTHGHWHFPAGEDITIVCSALPPDYLEPMPYTDPNAPDYVELYKYADLDALLELFGHLRAANPHSDVRVRTPDKVETDDYGTHLVLLGGVDWNSITAEFLHRLDVPVRQLPRENEAEAGGFVVGEGEDERLYAPELRREGDREILVKDVAHFSRAPSPLHDTRTVTICNGMYARGTHGIVRALTDAKFRDGNETYLRTRFAGEKAFSIVSRVKVFLGKTVTPDWSSSEDVLHEWPVRVA